MREFEARIRLDKDGEVIQSVTFCHPVPKACRSGAAQHFISGFASYGYLFAHAIWLSSKEVLIYRGPLQRRI
jgi:hypothetical protein